MKKVNKDKQHEKTLLERIKSIVWLAVKFIIAFAIIGWLISGHYKEFIMVFKNIHYNWLILALIFFAVTQLAAACRWYLLLKVQNIRISFFETFSLSLQGTFFSLVIPGGSLGGDLVRAGFLLSRTPKGNKLAASSTIFMDRFLGMFGQFSISIVAGLFFIPEINTMHDTAKTVIVLILIISLLGILAGIALLLHRQLDKIRLFSYFKKLADKLTKGFVSNAFEIIDVYNSSKKDMLKCIALGVIGVQLNMALILFFIAKGIHSSFSLTLSATKALILSIAMGNTAGLLPITPGGLGTRDAVVKATLTAGGFSQGNSIAIPLLFSIIMLIIYLGGGFFFLFHKRKKEHYIINKADDK